MTTYEERVATISAMRDASAGKFAAKLDFIQRCEILALHRAGISRIVLAEAYKLDRRTVTHIYNQQSPHYRMVREEEERLGHEEFLKRYLSESALARVQEVLGRPVVKKDVMFSRSASKYAGVHVLQTEFTTKPHRVMVAWREKGVDADGPGWYYQDADGTDPFAWNHHGDESRMTSKACYDAAVLNLFDM